jgi:hypothetical protein
LKNNVDDEVSVKEYDLIPLDLKQSSAAHMHRLKSIAMGISFCIGLTNNIKKADAITEPVFLDSLKILFETKKILSPVEQFILAQKYDQARTNINYCLNQLQLGKAVTNVIQGSLDYCDDMDLIDQASEASARITNTAVQLDSSVYTCVFIPGDDTGAVPPNADKYRSQAFGFLKSLNDDIDTLLKVSTPEQRLKAQSTADDAVKQLPSMLFTPKSKSTTI